MKAKSGKAKQRNDDEIASEEKHRGRCFAEAQILVAIDQVNASRSIALSLQVLIDTYREGVSFLGRCIVSPFKLLTSC